MLDIDFSNEGNFMPPLRFITSTALAVLLTSTAFAGGNHASGHGDVDAIGRPGDLAKVKRTIAVEMLDTMRFSPSTIKVKQDETIKFVVKNSGKIKHEMVLGTKQALKEHAQVMKKNPEMEHADANQVTVQPGQSGEVIWRFTQTGEVNFACLQPGHYDAGMKGAVKVSGHGAHKH
jgi:uncharacterized cupredoxin-like copper-binding protein